MSSSAGKSSGVFPTVLVMINLSTSCISSRPSQLSRLKRSSQSFFSCSSVNVEHKIYVKTLYHYDYSTNSTHTHARTHAHAHTHTHTHTHTEFQAKYLLIHSKKNDSSRIKSKDDTNCIKNYFSSQKC